MADKEKTPTFGGFDALGDTLITPGFNVDDEFPITDPENIIAEFKETPKPKSIKDINEDEENEEGIADNRTKFTEEPEDEETETGEEEEENEDEIKSKSKPKPTEEVKEPTEDELRELAEYETDITSVFQEKLGEELGWEFEEDEKFDTVKDFVDYMKEQVQEASKPTFATEEMEKLNEFVANGGSLRDFYDKSGAGGLNLDDFKIEDNPSNQKAVVREYLATRGYKDDRIQRTLDRYEEAGVLGEEAEDALELLKEYKEENKQKLLEQQKKQTELVKEQQQKFISDVEQYINSVEDIKGIKVSKKDKDKLIDDIFKPTADGRTAYQKKYASHIKNLVESAYFTMNDDTAIQKVQKKAESDAYKKVYQKLKAKGKRSKGSGSPETSEGDSDALGTLGRALI